MHGDDLVGLENAHLMGRVVHLDDTSSRAVRHAVEVAVDGNHAVTSDAAFQAQDRLERPGRELLKPGSFLSEMLGDDAPGHVVCTTQR